MPGTNALAYFVAASVTKKKNVLTTSCHQNKPKINEDPKDAMLREYQEEIQKLKELLDKQPQGSVPGSQETLRY
jgi:hypothetical protein